MMILRSSPPSPFGRKVKLALGILGLEKEVTIEKADPTDANDSIRQQNPLGKIPALIIEDGTVLYDSPVILEYLDHRAGGGKIIPQDAERALRGADPAGAVRRHSRCLHPAGLRRPLAAARDGTCRSGSTTRPARSSARSTCSKPRRPRSTRSRMSGRSRSPARSAIRTCASRANGARDYPKLVKWLDAFAAQVPAFEKTRVTA